jgi:hypothetical protein
VLNEVKMHIKRHKVAYSFGAGVVIAGITYTIVRSNIARGAMDGVTGRGPVANIASHFSFGDKTINVTTVLSRDGRGHPGWPVQNLETKQVFFSQKQAADAFGIPEKVLSGHIHGEFSDVDGLHFERVNLIPA